jgi:hypothetical protein
VTCAFAAGILAGRMLGLPTAAVLGLWLAAAVFSAIVFLTGRDGTAAASAVVYVMVLSTGMFAHDVRHREVRRDDVSHLVREEPLLVSLRGRVVREPWYSAFSRDEKAHRISYDLSAEGIHSGGGWADASGIVRVTQYGRAMEIPFGSRMEVTGRLFLPRPPTVPGQFDYTDYLARAGVRALLTVPGEFHARMTGRNLVNPLRLLAHHVRWHARRIITENFRRDEGAILEAVILGNRRAVGERWLSSRSCSTPT